jgi:hypothetical protein
VSRLSRHCGILNVSQPFRPPWLVTGMTLLHFPFYSLTIFMTQISRDCSQSPGETYQYSIAASKSFFRRRSRAAGTVKSTQACRPACIRLGLVAAPQFPDSSRSPGQSRPVVTWQRHHSIVHHRALCGCQHLAPSLHTSKPRQSYRR